jgi:hypothetical protein
MRIIVAGMVGQYPFGGVAWDYLQYCLGLAELGHDVVYHEDTGCWPFDPRVGHVSDDPAHSVAVLRGFFDRFAPHLSQRWHYQLNGVSHGMTRAAFDGFAASVDVFLNVSGASAIPDRLNGRAVKVFLDTDPGFNQFVLSERYPWAGHADRWAGQVAAHDRHLTYAENLGAADCPIPTLGYEWRPTRPVVVMSAWEPVRRTPIPASAPFTTVMTLGYFPGPVTYRGTLYDAKAVEFDRFLSLRHRTDLPIELLVTGDKVPPGPIRDAGWHLSDGTAATVTAADYQAVIARSAGEWSVAKNVYAATNSGWFSCRTACYLAAGRPAVVQETGWSRHVPSGAGVIAFSTVEEAAAALEDVTAEPERHRRAAVEIAREYLAADRVLPDLLASIWAGQASASRTGHTRL